MERAFERLAPEAVLQAGDRVLHDYLGRLVTIRRAERLMNRVIAQRDREMLGFLLLVHFYRWQEGGAPPTLARLQDARILTPRRTAGLIGLMRLGGYAHATPHPTDRRARILVPTERFIRLHRDWTRAAFRCLDRLFDTPLLEPALDRHPHFHRIACLRGARAIADGTAFAPGRYPFVDLLTHRRGGHQIAVNLAYELTAPGKSAAPRSHVVSLPFGLLARRLGVSRSHVFNLFVESQKVGFLRFEHAGETIFLSDRAAQDLRGYFAYELSYIGTTALEALAEFA